MTAWINTSAPTIKEAAEALREFKESILDADDVTITPIADFFSTDGKVHETRTNAYAATIEWSDQTPLGPRCYTYTLIQIIQGGLAPDGWATWETYKMRGRLSQTRAIEVIEMILRGIPTRVGGGEL